TPAEARSKQADALCSRGLPGMGQGNPDVVQVSAERHLLLSPLALAVAAQVVTQAGDAGFGQTARQPREETALLTRDATPMDEDHNSLRRAVRHNQRSGEVQAVE